MSEWDFRGCDTRFGVHGIHTYVAAMIPQLAGRLIDEYVPADGALLDPFCGGGAVLAEGVRRNRNAVIGQDVNPLAVLISKAKTTRVPADKSGPVLSCILNNVCDRRQQPLVPPTLAYWFKPEHLSPLHSLHEAIAKTVDVHDSMWPLFLTVFSATVRDVSLTYRNEVRLRKMSPEEIAKFSVDPIARFRDRAEKAIAAVDQLPPAGSANVGTGDARSMSLPDDSVSAIVCSPPYGDERNGVSYAQFSRNMLTWLGFSVDSIRKSKGLTLGWGKSERRNPRSPTLDHAMNAIAEFPASIHEATAFYADYQTALSEMARVTTGPIIIVIGPRVLRDMVFDNGAITVDLMDNLGVPLAHHFSRTLPSKRLPRMRKFGAAINREDILVFRA